MTTLEQAKIQIEDNGADIPTALPIADGKFKRYGPGKKYWYKLCEHVLATGKVLYFGWYGYNQGDNYNTQTIAMDWTGVSPEDRKQAEDKRKAVEREEAAKRAQEASNAAIRAGAQWRGAIREGHSPYLERKQVTAPAVRYLEDGTMLVPAVVLEPGELARLVGLQKIAPNGEKRFNKGMAMQGACCPIGTPGADDPIIFLTEGYATARSIAMATDGDVGGYIAFNAGNLPAVAEMARKLHPGTHILICADDDYQLEKRLAEWALKHWKLECPIIVDGVEHTLKPKSGEDVRVLATWRNDARGIPFIEVDARAGRRMLTATFKNAGIARATEAARAVGNASIVCPRFVARGENKWTDFNDLHVEESLDAVRQQMCAALFAALSPPDVVEQVAAEPAVSYPSTPVEPRAIPAIAAETKGPRSPLPPSDNESCSSDGDRWQARFMRSDKGNILPTLANAYLVLENDPKWRGVIAFDEFSSQEMKIKAPPFQRPELGPWTDKDDLRLMLWLQQTYGFAPRPDVLMGAVMLIADLNKFHAVRDYLDSLAWDGTERLASWMARHLGAEDSEYNRIVATKWPIAAVARIYRPGCKADNVLILEGEQGLNKSTALKVLGGEWFTDAPFRMGDKDAYIVIQGKWIVELAELDSFNKADSTGAKLFFGQYIDRFRPPYGKRAVDVPRMQLFAGTTNSDTYLKDETGNRRYWPVRCVKIDLESLARERDQLWAEAVAKFRAGVEWWPTSVEKHLFEEQQEERFVGDAYTSIIRSWLVGRSQATMPEILGDALKLDTPKWTKPEQQRVGRCMAEIGWKRKRDSKVVEGKRDWIYVRPSTDLAAQQGDEDEPY